MPGLVVALGLSLVGGCTAWVGGLLTGSVVGVGDKAAHANPTARINAAKAIKIKKTPVFHMLHLLRYAIIQLVLMTWDYKEINLKLQVNKMLLS